MSGRAVALLDRDGTINVKASEDAYITRAEDVVLLKGAARAIRMLNDAAIAVAVVTNQRGIARGLMGADDLVAVNARVAELLDHEGAHVDLWLHCPHDRGECACRKPGTAMLEEALSVLGGDRARSIMVGDSDSDIGAGRAAGVRSIRLAKQDDPSADATYGSLVAAVESIVGA